MYKSWQMKGNVRLTSWAAENHAVELEWIQMTCSPALWDVNVNRPSIAYIFTHTHHKHCLSCLLCNSLPNVCQYDNHHSIIKMNNHTSLILRTTTLQITQLVIVRSRFQDRISNSTNMSGPGTEPNWTRHRIFAFVSLPFRNLKLKLTNKIHTHWHWQCELCLLYVNFCMTE